MTEDPRCCGSGTCIIDPAGRCWCGQQWDGEKMCFPALKTSDGSDNSDSTGPSTNNKQDTDQVPLLNQRCTWHLKPRQLKKRLILKKGNRAVFRMVKPKVV